MKNASGSRNQIVMSTIQDAFKVWLFKKLHYPSSTIEFVEHNTLIELI